MRIIISILLSFFIASSSVAGQTFFSTPEECVAAARTGNADEYIPKTEAPFKGGSGWSSQLVSDGGACLSGAYVLEDGHLKKTGVVFVKKGFLYWKHTSGAFRMGKCSNPFGSIHLVGTDTRPTSTAPTVPAPQSACEGDGCGNTTLHRTVMVEVQTRVICRRFDGTTYDPGSIGAAGCREDVPVDVTIRPRVNSVCPSCGQGQSSSGNGSSVAVVIDHVKHTTNGRCLVSFTEAGQRRYVRLETKKGTNMLVAAQVANEQGDWVEENSLSYVGDGSATVTLNNPTDCQAAVKAFTSPRSFGWTARRIGLNPEQCVRKN